MSENALLEVRQAGKHFGGEYALQEVDFDLQPGEIHALLGENGAGKSTLVKVLAGVVQRDAGEISVEGNEFPMRITPAEVTRAGVAFVHQDLGLLDHLTVAENVALSAGYSRRRGGLISFRATERHVDEILSRLGVEVSASMKVQALSQDQKVMVAVARAFSLDARAIVLDEVTSSLPRPEAERLAESLRAARATGLGFVFVTHRLNEVFELADRITVLRNGRRVGTTATSETTHDDIVNWILGPAGAEVALNHRKRKRTAVKDRADGDELVVSALEGRGLSEPVSLSIAPGEIVAACGLVGCGARELAALIGGGERPQEGSVSLGEELPLGRPSELRQQGCNYVPGDRQGAGGVFNLTVRENLFLKRLGYGQQRDSAVRRPRSERQETSVLSERFDIRPRGRADHQLSALSGGNQQKVVIGRALRIVPRLLVVDDPTAGVDIGSRSQLHEIIVDAADSGTAVLLASTDFDEVAALADRALVFFHGRVSTELSGHKLTADNLARASYGPSDFGKDAA